MCYGNPPDERGSRRPPTKVDADRPRRHCYAPLMTSIGPRRDVEPEVQFLNVDLELFGKFDRGPLMRSFGDAVFVLCDDAELLSMEVSDHPDSTMLERVSQFVALVRALPEDARRIWGSATRRVLNIGIQSGLEPRCSEWTLPVHILASLAESEVEVTLTVYGAQYEKQTLDAT